MFSHREGLEHVLFCMVGLAIAITWQCEGNFVPFPLLNA